MPRAVLILAALAGLVATPAQAGRVTYEVIEEWVEEAPSSGAVRFVSPAVAQAESRAIASFGPFRVIDGRTAALIDVTDSRTPAQFMAMLRSYPQLATLRFLECPGTYDDQANLRLGRMIRAAGLAAVVPAEGSVRSGAVELVIAGTSRSIDDRAEFAVHAWQDESGMEAGDYAAGADPNARYLAYYREMGMAADVASAFYAMTNSVRFEDARWLTGAEMRRWMGESASGKAIAHLDLGAGLN